MSANKARRRAPMTSLAHRLSTTLPVALAVAAVLSMSCAGAALKGRVAAVDALIATARDNGAQRCAPVELAMAESHVDFAKADLAEGQYYRAKAETGIAEENARAAVQKSPKDLCVPAKKPKPVVVTEKDKDGDGILDKDDRCPSDPEDKDDFEDEDGCPDTDNDKDGILDDDDKCPMEAEDKDRFEDEDGCPDADNDKDGILDESDKCPMEPEDKDGFEDEDGCPELDNDLDGLADNLDKCPLEPEDKDGFEDEDGCPDCDNDGDGVPECPTVVDMCPNKAAETPDGCPVYKLVVVTAKKIELKQTVFFEYNKARIRTKSYPLLNDVAQVLKDNDSLRVRVEGHTDSRGSDRFNMRLSQGRAESVREYMIGQGIDPTRMEAQGFGETQPIADNRTEKGRAQNRRVEFVILDR
jgi:OOP family OmpA-OmpF porin